MATALTQKVNAIMCLICFSYQHVPGYRLLLAANRDEFWQRPTAALAFLDTKQQILAGQDLQSGGTWLGVSRSGKLAAITNYRDPRRHKVPAPSRGEILLKYLQGSASAREFLQQLHPAAQQYNDFNLLLLDAGTFFHYSSITGCITSIVPGLHGVSNHLLDTPWPKVRRVKQLFTRAVASSPHQPEQALLAMLTDRQQPAEQDLPATGVSLEWEKLLAPVFITSPAYGTRSSAVLSITVDGLCSFCERSYDQSGKITGEKTARLRLAANVG